MRAEGSLGIPASASVSNTEVSLATNYSGARASLAEPPKHILVNGKRIKFKFIQTLIWSTLCALVGAWVVTAIYYGVTQVDWSFFGHHLFYLKPGWDGLFKYNWWHDARHDYRDCYEAVFATLFVKSIIAKRKSGHVGALISKLTHRPFKPVPWDKKVATWRVATAPLMIFLVAFPIITLGIWIVDIHNSTLPTSVHTYQSFLIGFVAGQVVHRFYAPIGNTVQLHFVNQMLDHNLTPHWPLPPVIRERHAWVKSTGQGRSAPGRNSWVDKFTYPTVSLGLLFLAGYGAYVRFVVAKS